VIHYNMPRSLEGYVQEIGRAGRDAADSNCVVLYNDRDVRTLKNYVYAEEPDIKDVKTLIQHIFGNKSALELSEEGELVVHLNLFQLSRELDMPQALLSRLLAYLGELRWGLLKERTPMYMQYQWETIAEIPQESEGQDKKAFQYVLEHAVRKRKLTHLNIEKPDMTDRDRAIGIRVNRLLNDWASVGFIKNLKVTQLRHRYEVNISADRMVPPDDFLAKSLSDFASDYVKREVRRIEETGWLLSQRFEPMKIQAFLAQRFGLGAKEELGLDFNQILSETTELKFKSEIPDSLVSEIQQAIPPGVYEEGGARLVAKFLIGMSSPKIAAMRLSSHEMFGSYSTVDFRALHSALERLYDPMLPTDSEEAELEGDMLRRSLKLPDNLDGDIDKFPAKDVFKRIRSGDL